jgi:hypothetical protein
MGTEGACGDRLTSTALPLHVMGHGEKLWRQAVPELFAERDCNCLSDGSSCRHKPTKYLTCALSRNSTL